MTGARISRLVYGWHAVNAALKQSRFRADEIFYLDSRSDGRMMALQGLAAMHDIPARPLSAVQFGELLGSAVSHQGIAVRGDYAPLARHLDEVLLDLTEPPLLLVLDGIQDPHNLGACLRTADGMGVHAVIAPKDRAVGLNATVAKVACGAADTVPYLVVTNLARTLTQLQELGIFVVGAASDAPSDLYHFKQSGALAWVLGNEANGLRRLTKDRCDALVSIPMAGQVESLNVSVAASICLFEARRQRMS